MLVNRRKDRVERQKGHRCGDRLNGRTTGYSLIEVLVVLVIIGLIAGLVGPQFFGRVETSKVKTADTQIKMLKTSLQTYRLDNGTYPSTDEGLLALVRRPHGGNGLWQGPYLDDELPLDPWSRPYQYRLEPSSTQTFVLYSMGADGQPGGEGLDADVGYLPI